MKLGSLKRGRDGELMVVSRDLRRMAPAEGIAETLQQALDEWHLVAPKLEKLSKDLEKGKIEGQPFVARAFASPLPRAYQWADGSAYVTHVERSEEHTSELPVT